MRIGNMKKAIVMRDPWRSVVVRSFGKQRVLSDQSMLAFVPKSVKLLLEGYDPKGMSIKMPSAIAALLKEKAFFPMERKGLRGRKDIAYVRIFETRSSILVGVQEKYVRCFNATAEWHYSRPKRHLRVFESGVLVGMVMPYRIDDLQLPDVRRELPDDVIYRLPKG